MRSKGWRIYEESSFARAIWLYFFGSLLDLVDRIGFGVSAFPVSFAAPKLGYASDWKHHLGDYSSRVVFTSREVGRPFLMYNVFCFGE